MSMGVVRRKMGWGPKPTGVDTKAEDAHPDVKYNPVESSSCGDFAGSESELPPPATSVISSEPALEMQAVSA